jgi:Tfp pilus assembly protein PilF
MDGRTFTLVWLGLALASSGCITTTEKNVTFRDQADPQPATTAKDEGTKEPPAKMLFAMARMKEGLAESSKDNPETQQRARDEARRTYQEILKNEPDNIDAFRALARVYTRMGDYDRAQDTYRKALAKHPRDVSLWYDCGMMHDQRKNWPEGAKCFQQGLAIDPENQNCMKALGFTLARAGQLDQSLQYLTRAMGSPAAAHYNIARMLLHLGSQQPDQRAAFEDVARQQLRHALECNASHEGARALLAHLDLPPGVSSCTVEMPVADLKP